MIKLLLFFVAIFAISLCTWAFFLILGRYADEQVESWMEEK